MSRSIRRFSLVLAAASAASTILPQTALAHGVSGRLDLPLPGWLFGWAAAIVLAISFVALGFLWAKPKFESPAWRPLPYGFGRAIASRPVVAICQVVGLLLLGLVLYSGAAGTQDVPGDNFAPVFVYVVFWVGLVVVSLLFGDVFRAFNPWLAIGRAVDFAMARLTGSRDGYVPPFEYPTWLGRWPAAIGIFAFAWTELVSDIGAQPSSIALAVAIYTAIQFAGCLMFGSRQWIDHGEAFGGYFNLFARISPLQLRDREVGLQAPLSALASWQPLNGGVALLAVMIGTVTFDGASNGELWAGIVKAVAPGTVDASGASDSMLVSGAGMTACVLIVWAFYWLGILGVKSVARSAAADVDLSRAFVHSLAPIAAAYAIAHYLNFLLFQGPDLTRVMSDPLGRGSDIFGTANTYFEGLVIPSNTFWYVQIGIVIAGHVAALVLAHDRALALFRNTREAIRSQYYLLVVMIGFTSLALWLLSESNR